MAANKSKDDAYDEEPMVVTLVYDDGTEIETEVMGIFEVKDKEYIALIPDDNSDDVYLYGYAEVGEDEFELLDIEDEDEFNQVVKEFDVLMGLEGGDAEVEIEVEEIEEIEIEVEEIEDDIEEDDDDQADDEDEE